jgi:hypothetical protein
MMFFSWRCIMGCIDEDAIVNILSRRRAPGRNTFGKLTEIIDLSPSAWTIWARAAEIKQQSRRRLVALRVFRNAGALKRGIKHDAEDR